MVASVVRGAAAAILLLAASTGARADNVLEQMQTEIARIVARSRGAVVSIEDGRALRASAGASSEAAALAGRIKVEVRGNAQGAEPLANARRKPEGSAAQAGLERSLAELQSRITGVQGLSARIPVVLGGAPKLGSGFSIGDGYVVTTADVLEGMEAPMVVTDDGRRIQARVAGLSAELNVGLLKLDSTTSLPALAWGDSTALQPGFFAISIGNQSGQASSVALTLVSAIRSDGTFSGEHFYPGLIQVAGTVGAGTSGAPLLNPRGEVVGVMAAMPVGPWAEASGAPLPNVYRATPAPPAPGKVSPALPQAPGASDVTARRPEPGTPPWVAQIVPFVRPPVSSAGFAIPSEDARQVVEDLKAARPASRGWIGVDLGEETRVSESDGVMRVLRSVLIRGVYPGSPAARAGMESGDALQSLAGQPVRSMGQVRTVVLRLKPGDTLDVVVVRGGKPQSLKLKIEARPAEIKGAPVTRPGTP